jgi:hypothetical protein
MRTQSEYLTGRAVSQQIDGSMESNKERRNGLWAISEKRAVYPQVSVQAVIDHEHDMYSMPVSAVFVRK